MVSAPTMHAHDHRPQAADSLRSSRGTDDGRWVTPLCRTSLTRGHAPAPLQASHMRSQSGWGHSTA
jgi:hypothetical protein